MAPTDHYHLTRMAPVGPNELRPPVWECYGTFEIVSEEDILLSIFKRVTPAKGSFWAYREPQRYAEALDLFACSESSLIINYSIWNISVKGVLIGELSAWVSIMSAM